MPYLTEELNRKIFNNDTLLIAESWPQTVAIDDDDAVDEIGFLISLISEIRYIRAEMNVPLSAKPRLHIRGASDLQTRAIAGQQTALLRMARLDGHDIVETFTKGSACGSVDGIDIGLPLADILDLEAEAARLQKEIGSVSAEIEKLVKKTGQCRLYRQGTSRSRCRKPPPA
jgi:valyl-tRNA synthetase